MAISFSGTDMRLLWLRVGLAVATVLAASAVSHRESTGNTIVLKPDMQESSMKESSSRVPQPLRWFYGRSLQSILAQQVSPRAQRNNEKCGILGRGGGARIVGGTIAYKHEFPWMVSIQKKSPEKAIPFCGGTVIDNKWVITAKHCTNIFNKETILVVAGEHNLKKKEGAEQWSDVERIESHPSKDIALLKLAVPLILDYKTVSPICLPPKNFSFSGKCVATGWGYTKESGSPSDILRKVVMPIVSDRECRKIYRDIKVLSTDMICAGFDAGGKDSCKDDSGGPLVCPGANRRQLLAGVVSFGLGCAQPGVPGVYVEVSRFVDWIIEIISKKKQP